MSLTPVILIGMGMEYQTKTHDEVLIDLGFVHRQLPGDDPRHGTQFVPGDEYGSDWPWIVVVVDAHQTRIQGWSSTRQGYTVTFDASTPPAVVTQAAAAALGERLVGRPHERPR